MPIAYFPCPQCNDSFLLDGNGPWPLRCACGWSGTVGATLTETDIRRIIREELRAWQEESAANAKAHRFAQRAGMNGGLHSF